METFGTWLSRELGKRDWSARKLAGLLGVSGTAVNRWIHDEREPDRAMLLEIAGALDISPVTVGLAYLGLLPEARRSEVFNHMPPDAQAEVLAAMQELMDVVFEETARTRRAVGEWSERWMRSGAAAAVPGGRAVR